MDEKEIGGASSLFIVRDVLATLAFYRDKLGFDVTFEGPEPDDIFFGIVQRGRAMIMIRHRMSTATSYISAGRSNRPS